MTLSIHLLFAVVRIMVVASFVMMPTTNAFVAVSQRHQHEHKKAPFTTMAPDTIAASSSYTTPTTTTFGGARKGLATLIPRNNKNNNYNNNRHTLFMAAPTNAAADEEHDAAEEFPKNLVGPVYHRPQPDFTLEVGHGALQYFEPGADPATRAYVEEIYGYGTTSFPHRNTPAAVVKVKNAQDIQRTIDYAYKSGIAIAIRSGGHQYGAFCSTTHKNIVMDLSDPDADFNQDPVYNEVDKTWKVGAGVTLANLRSKLQEKGSFVPHGECTLVRCGGHLHTGGYSPFFSRSFGLFIDHITEFTIIVAPSNKTKDKKAESRIVKKPVEGNPSDDDDLWFAVMGGSPGFLGVVTDMTIKPLWDKDHKEARALTYARPYTKAGFRQVIEILTKFCDDDNLPADYDFNVFMLQSRNTEIDEKGRENLDTCMRDFRPDIYGPKPETSIPIFALVVNWNNVNGVGFDETDKDGYNASEIFESIKKGLGSMAPSNKPPRIPSGQQTIGGRLKDILDLDGEKAMTISDLDRILGFAARIEANPYYGTDRVYIPPAEQGPNLGATNFVTETVDIVDEAYNDNKFDCWPTPQWGTTGGKHSRLRKDMSANPNIALSQRMAYLNCIYYVHFDNVKGRNDTNDAGRIAKDNVERMETALVKAFGGDHRWIAFCGQDANLEDLWPYYFDSKPDFDRVKKVKQDYDPNNVFTPHKFGVSSE